MHHAAEQMALSFKHGFWANALEFLAEIWYGPRASLCRQRCQAFFHLELRWPGYLVTNLSVQQSRDASSKPKCDARASKSVVREAREVPQVRTHAQMVKTNVATTTMMTRFNPHKKTFKNRKRALNEKMPSEHVKCQSNGACLFFSSQYIQGCMRYSSLKLSAISCAGSGTVLRLWFRTQLSPV